MSRLAANPPTLEMALQQRQAEAAAARTAAEQATREADAAQKVLAEKRRIAKTATEAAAAATKAAESIATEKAALEKAKYAPLECDGLLLLLRPCHTRNPAGLPGGSLGSLLLLRFCHPQKSRRLARRIVRLFTAGLAWSVSIRRASRRH